MCKLLCDRHGRCSDRIREDVSRNGFGRLVVAQHAFVVARLPQSIAMGLPIRIARRLFEPSDEFTQVGLFRLLGRQNMQVIGMKQDAVIANSNNVDVC